MPVYLNQAPRGTHVNAAGRTQPRTATRKGIKDPLSGDYIADTSGILGTLNRQERAEIDRFLKVNPASGKNAQKAVEKIRQKYAEKRGAARQDLSRGNAYYNIPQGYGGADPQMLADAQNARNEIASYANPFVDQSRAAYAQQMQDYLSNRDALMNAPLVSTLEGQRQRELAQRDILGQISQVRGRYNPGVTRAAMAQSGQVGADMASGIAAAAAKERLERQMAASGIDEQASKMQQQQFELERALQAQNAQQKAVANQTFLAYMQQAMNDKQFRYGARMGYWDAAQQKDIANAQMANQMKMAKMQQEPLWEKILGYGLGAAGALSGPIALWSQPAKAAASAATTAASGASAYDFLK